MEEVKSKRIRYVIDEIRDQYLLAENSHRPWIIGFSGGKDSTVLLTLVWYALKSIKKSSNRYLREVHIICNDTLVENPLITSYVNGVLSKIKKAIPGSDLPFFVHQTIPRLEDSFWVNMIGRGYPAPNNAFRWCTDRLKIRPTSRYIKETLDSQSEATILLGTRKAESVTRAKSIKRHSVRGKRLTKHPSHHNVWVYSPIKDLMLEEIWYVINAVPSPWDADNSELFKIYSDASADDYECPTVITTKNHKSCGQSRFGCWVCTVIKEDKSMSALIDNGMNWMEPLLAFRDAMVAERNILKNRSEFRRNGSDAKNGLGKLAEWYQADLLKRLLEVQKKVQEHDSEIELITHQELVAIQVIWYRDLNFKHKVSDIYNNIYSQELDMKDQNERVEKEKVLLEEACGKNPGNFEIIQDLLILQKNKALLNKKRGLKEDLERRIAFSIKKDHPKKKENVYKGN